MHHRSLAGEGRGLVNGLLNSSRICARRYLEHRSIHADGRSGKRRNGAVDAGVGDDLIVLGPRARVCRLGADGNGCGHGERVSHRNQVRAGGGAGVHGNCRTRGSRFAADYVVNEKQGPDVTVGYGICLNRVEDLVVLNGDGRRVLPYVLRQQESVRADRGVSTKTEVRRIVDVDVGDARATKDAAIDVRSCRNRIYWSRHGRCS